MITDCHGPGHQCWSYLQCPLQSTRCKWLQPIDWLDWWLRWNFWPTSLSDFNFLFNFYSLHCAPQERNVGVWSAIGNLKLELYQFCMSAGSSCRIIFAVLLVFIDPLLHLVFNFDMDQLFCPVTTRHATQKVEWSVQPSRKNIASLEPHWSEWRLLVGTRHFQE